MKGDKNKNDWAYANWDVPTDTILLEHLIESINNTLAILQEFPEQVTPSEAITMITQVTDQVTRIRVGIDKLPANW